MSASVVTGHKQGNVTVKTELVNMELLNWLKYIKLRRANET